MNSKSIEKLKDELTLKILEDGKLGNEIDTVIAVEPVKGYAVCSVDVNFDDETDIDGWAYDTKREKHTITKTSVRFCKTNSEGKFTIKLAYDCKFVVTIHNDSMYCFDTYTDGYNATYANKPECPIGAYW